MAPGWWAKYGHIVLGAGIIFMAVVVSVIMVVFSYQWGVDVSNNIQSAPSWMDQAMQMARNQTPPGS